MNIMRSLSGRILVLLLLVFSFFSCADNGDLQEKKEVGADYYSVFEQKHIQKEQERLTQDRQVLDEKMDMYFDGKIRKYKPGITEKDKAQYYQYYVELEDLIAQRTPFRPGYYMMAYDRFDRSSVQPELTQNVFHKAEQEIQVILEQCIKNGIPKDSLYDLYIDIPQVMGEVSLPTIHDFIDEREFDHTKYYVQSYLYGRVDRCVYYLYDDPRKYDLSDFDYSPKTNHYHEVEKLYEQAYLKIRVAGLLRKLPGAYYPKSFVRAHADKTGLTKYIQQQEKKVGRHLPHKYLAADYFGSYEEWIRSLNVYLNLLKL